MSITTSRRTIGAALAGAALFATGGVVAVSNLAAAQDETTPRQAAAQTAPRQAAAQTAPRQAAAQTTPRQAAAQTAPRQAAAQTAPQSDATCYADGSEGGWTHPFGFPQPKARDVRKEGFNVAIEIPQGSFAKYEIDADTGSIIVDRFQSMPVAYPGNYGSISQSKGGDGDPLDALVVTREPSLPDRIFGLRRSAC